MKRLAAAALLALTAAGCATRSDLEAFRPASSERAVVRWQRSDAVINCDAVCARSSEGVAAVRLYKESPTALVEFRLQPDGHFSASGNLAGRGWSGPAENAPAPLSVWAAWLGAYAHAADLPVGMKEIHSPANRMAFVKSEDKLESLSVASTDSAEAVNVVFR
mgnify:CR=1 FL=1